MKLGLVACGIFGVVSITDAPCSAQQFASRGTIALGADRMFGYVSFTENQVTPDAAAGGATTQETSSSNFSLLGRTSAANPPQIPRLSFDVFYGTGISLGVSAMYEHYSTGQKTNGISSPDKPTDGIWLFSPRVGFGHMFSPHFGIWPRVGVTYAHDSLSALYTDLNTGASVTTTTSTSEWYISIDANLVLVPVPHVGFTLGPTYDHLLSENVSATPTQAPTTPSTYSAHALGIQAGLLAWF